MVSNLPLGTRPLSLILAPIVLMGAKANPENLNNKVDVFTTTPVATQVKGFSIRDNASAPRPSQIPTASYGVIRLNSTNETEVGNFETNTPYRLTDPTAGNDASAAEDDASRFCRYLGFNNTTITDRANTNGYTIRGFNCS